MTYITSEELAGILKQNNDDLVSRIREECRAATMLLGINSDNPQEMQEIMSFMRQLKRDSETIRARITTKIIDALWVIIISILVSGFTYIYCTKQTPVTLRDEKVQIHKIQKDKEV